MKRIINLDFLRGFCVLLALVQHTFYYNNTFFIDLDLSAYSQVIKTYADPYLNNLIPLDSFAVWKLNVFMMWVSHIYIFLSAFNLAKRKQEQFKLMPKLKLFGTLFIIFTLESFILGANFGEMISLHPLLTWMILLSMISIVYKYFDLLGVVLFYVIAFILTYIVNDLNLGNAFEHLVQIHIHKEYLYDARLEYFALTSIGGFIIGYCYHHYNSSKKYLYGLLLSILFFAIAYILGFTMYWAEKQSMYNNFRNEGLYYYNIANLLYIQSILIFLVNLFLYLEDKKIVINIKLFNYISINSLFIFAIHKLLIVKLINPLRLLINSYTSWDFTASGISGFTYAFIIIFISYIILKLDMAKIIAKVGQDKKEKDKI